MEIGLHLPQFDPLATREGITGFAQLAEEHGFESLWVSDHVIVPREMSSRYPYSGDGAFPIPPDLPMLEPIATLLFAAGVTQRAKLGTTVLVIPMAITGARKTTDAHPRILPANAYRVSRDNTLSAPQLTGVSCFA